MRNAMRLSCEKLNNNTQTSPDICAMPRHVEQETKTQAPLNHDVPIEMNAMDRVLGLPDDAGK